MLSYQEPDAVGASTPPPAHSATPKPRQERVRHLVYGSLAGIERTVKILHALGYAEPGEWSAPMPMPTSARERSIVSGEPAPDQWMVSLTKILLMEEG